MRQRTRPRKPITLKVGNDPALHRFTSVQDALAANRTLLARLIQTGSSERSLTEAQTRIDAQ